MRRGGRYVLSPALQAELLTHPNRWVACTRSYLLAVGDSPAEVLEQARAKGAVSPILYHVPDPNTRYFFLAQVAGA